MDPRPLSYDVVVVGGGAAGLAAAVAAGGAGARTALVERYGFLGGMATAGMVSTICGLYHTSPSGTPEPLNEGFADAFARRLAAMPGCQQARPARADVRPALHAVRLRLPGRRAARRGPAARRLPARVPRRASRPAAGRIERCASRPGSGPSTLRGAGRSWTRAATPSSPISAGAATETAAAVGPPVALAGLRPPAGRYRGARRRAPVWRCCEPWSRPSGTDACPRAPRTSRWGRRRSPARSSASSPSAVSPSEPPERRDFLTAAEQEGPPARARRHRVPEDAAAPSRAPSSPTWRRRSASARAGA